MIVVIFNLIFQMWYQNVADAYVNHKRYYANKWLWCDFIICLIFTAHVKVFCLKANPLKTPLTNNTSNERFDLFCNSEFWFMHAVTGIDVIYSFILFWMQSCFPFHHVVFQVFDQRSGEKHVTDIQLEQMCSVSIFYLCACLSSHWRQRFRREVKYRNRWTRVEVNGSVMYWHFFTGVLLQLLRNAVKMILFFFLCVQMVGFVNVDVLFGCRYRLVS